MPARSSDGLPMWWMDVLDAEGNPTEDRVTTKNYAQASRYEQGSALPLFYGGLTNTFEYNGISFSFFFYYSYGGKNYDYTMSTISHDGSSPGTQLIADELNSWTPTNTNTDIPVFIPNNSYNGNARSTRFLFDGSYVRLKNVTLAYSFPESLLTRIKLSGARVYVQGENLLTFTEHKGLGPEVGLSGFDDNDVPNAKTITFGLSFDF
ncbi:MAG: hypothetical protein HC831_16055 [Chloroflexia bacterium]|nr:hypothetical protein [Chloroflexia bacterium]